MFLGLPHYVFEIRPSPAPVYEDPHFINIWKHFQALLFICTLRLLDPWE